MKKIFFLITIFLVSCIFLASVKANYDKCTPIVELATQEPNPAVPNSYVKVIFEISGLGNCDSGYAI